jgi:hypothetical protein
MSRPRPADWRDVVGRGQASGQPMKAFGRDRGMPPSTFRDWVFEAGEETRRPHPKRQHYDKARAEGLSPWKAALATGVAWETARHWSPQ